MPSRVGVTQPLTSRSELAAVQAALMPIMAFTALTGTAGREATKATKVTYGISTIPASRIIATDSPASLRGSQPGDKQRGGCAAGHGIGEKGKPEKPGHRYKIGRDDLLWVRCPKMVRRHRRSDYLEGNQRDIRIGRRSV